MECGTVDVPENRDGSTDAGNTIHLAVAVFHATVPDPADDPVVFLAGGPGGGGIDAALLMFDSFRFLLEKRDLVVFDQRGTGYTEPSLDCGVDDPQRCRDRLVGQGIDLSSYTTRNNAADVDLLRQALGYEQIDLLGGSYGTRLGLAVLRDHPDGIRSAVLDSVAPLQVNTGPGVVGSTAHGLRVLLDGCASDPACAVSYPDVEAELYAAVRALDARPATVEVNGRPVPVDGADFVQLIVSSMYYTEAIPRLPQLVSETAAGDYALLASFLLRVGEAGGDLSEGMMWSVECAENTAFETTGDFTVEAASLDAAVRDHVVGASLWATGICEVWDVPPVPSADKEPVSSDVPSLLLAGQYDPVTPLGWAQLAAQSLRGAFVYEFPASGHGVFRTSDCARSIIDRFLDDPRSAPDTSCIGDMPAPTFTVGAPA